MLFFRNLLRTYVTYTFCPFRALLEKLNTKFKVAFPERKVAEPIMGKQGITKQEHRPHSPHPIGRPEAVKKLLFYLVHELLTATSAPAKFRTRPLSARSLWRIERNESRLFNY